MPRCHYRYVLRHTAIFTPTTVYAATPRSLSRHAINACLPIRAMPSFHFCLPLVWHTMRPRHHLRPMPDAIYHQRRRDLFAIDYVILLLAPMSFHYFTRRAWFMVIYAASHELRRSRRRRYDRILSRLHATSHHDAAMRRERHRLIIIYAPIRRHAAATITMPRRRHDILPSLRPRFYTMTPGLPLRHYHG